MERSIVWSVLAVGMAGWLYCLLASRAVAREEPGSAPRSFWIAAIALSILVFLVTLPSKAPFAAGQSLGKGFALGSIGALLAGWVALRLTQGSDDDRLAADRAGAAVAAPHSMALVVCTIALHSLRFSLLDSLMGAAIGWFCVTALLLVGLLGNERKERRRSFPLIAGLGFAVTLCAFAALGELRGAAHFGRGTMVSWSVIGLAFASGIPVVLLLTSLPSGILARLAGGLPLAGFAHRLAGGVLTDAEAEARGIRAVRSGVCVLLMLGLGKLLSMRVSSQPHLNHVFWIGIASGLLAWWLIATRDRTPADDKASQDWLYGGLAILVLLAGSMAAFQMLAGVGVGLMAISAWLTGGLVSAFALEPATGDTLSEGLVSAKTERQVLRLLFFAVVLLLFRLFAARYPAELRGVGLTDQFALFGIVVGAVLPLLFSGYLLRTADSQTTSGSLFRVCVTGVITLLVPAVVLLLWGAKCGQAMVIGVGLSLVLMGTGESLLPALFALAVALALTQWTQHVLDVVSLSRDEKLHILKWLVGSLAVVVIVGDYVSRIGRPRRTSPAQAPASAPGGAAK